MPPPRIATLAREPVVSFPSPAPVRKSGGFASAPGLFYGLGMSPSNTGQPITPYTAVGVAAVYACVKRISEDVAKLPILLQRRQTRGWVVDIDHPLNRVLREPNRWQTRSQAWQFLIGAFSMRGNGVAAIVRDRNSGAPIDLLPIPADRWSPLQSSDTGDYFYQFTHPFYPGKTFRLHQDNVLHIRTGSYDGIMGVPPIYQAPDVFGLAISAQTHGSTLFRQGAQLNGVIKHPNTLSPQAKDYISASVDTRFAGVNNAHKTLVLEEGMTFEKVQMTNEDAQFVESRKFSVIEVCRLYSMPPHKVFDLEHAHFDNVENGEQQYINDCLQPILQQCEETLEKAMLFDDEKGQFRLMFDYRALLKGDRKTRSEVYHSGIADGWMKRNEARSEEGLPIDNTDLDEYILPLNMGPQDGPVAAPGVTQPNAPTATDPDQEEDTD